MKQLIATVRFPYAGKPLSAGDPFEATEGHAKLLILLGRAKEAGSRVAPAGTTKRRTRRYKRRDMRPEA